MSYKNLICRKKGKVYHITLNRPKKLNALSKALLLELDKAITEADGNDDVSVIDINLSLSPSGRNDTSVIVEVVSEFLRSMDQGSDLLRYLVQHLPRRPIQVGGTDEDNLSIDLALVLFDRNQSSGLPIP